MSVVGQTFDDAVEEGKVTNGSTDDGGTTIIPQGIVADVWNQQNLVPNPHTPPASGRKPLMDLPVELLHQIVVDLDAISYHSIILASRELRAILHGTFSTAFILSKAEYVLFNKMYEEHAGRKPRRLLCAMCTNLLTDAKFADRQAGQFCQTVRTCVSCGINNGKYNRATFIYKGNTRFGCAGCKLPCKMENEEQGIGEFTFTEHFPFRDPGYGRAVEISLDARGKRWCKTCWRGAMGFMESIGMKNHTQLKVKQVWL